MNELNLLEKQVGQDHPIYTAAKKYWQYHPTHSFCPLEDNDWWMDLDGSVWTPQACGDPVIESELFFAHDSFYEICWNAGDVEAVFKDGNLTWTAHQEAESIYHQVCIHLEYDSFQALTTDIEAAYRLNCNPLPAIRQILKSIPISVQFGLINGGHFWADDQKATLVVRLDDETGQVNLELIDYYVDDNHQWWEHRLHDNIPLIPSKNHRDVLYCAARDNHLLTRFEKKPAQPAIPAPGPRKVAPKQD